MYAIAGVSENTGSVVADTLLAQGEPVRVIVRDAAKGDTWRASGAEIAVAELHDRRGLTAALAGAKGAYVLVPPLGTNATCSVETRRRQDARHLGRGCEGPARRPAVVGRRTPRERHRADPVVAPRRAGARRDRRHGDRRARRRTSTRTGAAASACSRRGSCPPSCPSTPASRRSGPRHRQDRRGRADRRQSASA